VPPRSGLRARAMQIVEFIRKDWGTTGRVVSEPTFRLDHIKVLPGGFCSNHLHRRRGNGFYVLSGSLTVRTPDGDYHMKAGQYLMIAAGIRHQFATAEGCEAIEIYLPQLPEDEDIVRFSVGGIEK
jgi:mannose-6-phosphate isomerase-like protein (cupin superfamily)